MSRLIKALKKAINNNEDITIIYHGGSAPGATRTVTPIAMNNEWNIDAICHQSRQIKTFTINKIELIDAMTGEIIPPDIDPGNKPAKSKTKSRSKSTTRRRGHTNKQEVGCASVAVVVMFIVTGSFMYFF